MELLDFLVIYLKGAGTNVTTDIVLFQKLRSGETGNIDIWNKNQNLMDIK